LCKKQQSIFLTIQFAKSIQYKGKKKWTRKSAEGTRAAMQQSNIHLSYLSISLQVTQIKQKSMLRSKMLKLEFNRVFTFSYLLHPSHCHPIDQSEMQPDRR